MIGFFQRFYQIYKAHKIYITKTKVIIVGESGKTRKKSGKSQGIWCLKFGRHPVSSNQIQCQNRYDSHQYLTYNTNHPLPFTFLTNIYIFKKYKTRFSIPSIKHILILSTIFFLCFFIQIYALPASMYVRIFSFSSYPFKTFKSIQIFARIDNQHYNCNMIRNSSFHIYTYPVTVTVRIMFSYFKFFIFLKSLFTYAYGHDKEHFFLNLHISSDG